MKRYSHFFSKNISIYAIFSDQSFNDRLTNDIISFEQLGPGKYIADEKQKCWLTLFGNMSEAEMFHHRDGIWDYKL